MGFVALHFAEGRQKRVFVVQADDKTVGHKIFAEEVDGGAAIGVGFQRPADRVQRQAGLKMFWFDFPQFLDADGVGLRVVVRVEVENFHQLFAE